MKKWIVITCCAVILLGGCSGSGGGSGSDNSPNADTDQNPVQQLATNGESNLTEGADGEVEGVDTELLSYRLGPALSIPLMVRQSDGLTAEMPGYLALNEAIGYYLYIAPGYRGEVNSDSGTLILSDTTGGAQAVIEALPPQADVQFAADELKTIMQRIDENMMQVTEYSRHAFWSDAAIYRAYDREDRITAIIKQVHNIPLRITITEGPDNDNLNDMMSMISSISIDEFDMLTTADDHLMKRLIDLAQRLQSDILEPYIPVDEDNPVQQSTSSKPSDEGGPLQLKLHDIVQSKEELHALLEVIYTPEAAKKAADLLGVSVIGSEWSVKLPNIENPLHWEQATLSLISATDNQKRYLLRVPAGEDGLSKLQEIDFRKLSTGWRLHTPLAMWAEHPADDGEETGV